MVGCVKLTAGLLLAGCHFEDADDGAPHGVRDVPDGARMGDAAWNALPTSVRQHMFQVSEIYRAVGTGTIMPYRNLAPRPLLLLERKAADTEIMSAFMISSRTSKPSEIIVGPPQWALGEIQVLRDATSLAELDEGILYKQQEFGFVKFRGQTFWYVVMRSPDAVGFPRPYGFDGSTWYASATWFHEHFHGLQPHGYTLPEGWNPSRDRYVYPAADVHFGGLQWLENVVLVHRFTSANSARDALETFLAIRDKRRTLFPDMVATYEQTETLEGVASYAEGRFLEIIGREAISPDTGKVYSFPQKIPEDPATWLPFFFGEFEYSTGCAIAQALTVLVGSAWKDSYCSYANEETAPTLVGYTRQYVTTPVGEHAERLYQAAAHTYGLPRLETRIREANFVAQWRALDFTEPAVVKQDHSAPGFIMHVTNKDGTPARFPRLRLTPNPTTTIDSDVTTLFANQDGRASADKAITLRPDLPPGEHVVAIVETLDFPNPPSNLIYTI